VPKGRRDGYSRCGPVPETSPGRDSGSSGRTPTNQGAGGDGCRAGAESAPSSRIARGSDRTLRNVGGKGFRKRHARCIRRDRARAIYGRSRAQAPGTGPTRGGGGSNPPAALCCPPRATTDAGLPTAALLLHPDQQQDARDNQRKCRAASRVVVRLLKRRNELAAQTAPRPAPACHARSRRWQVQGKNETRIRKRSRPYAANSDGRQGCMMAVSTVCGQRSAR